MGNWYTTREAVKRAVTIMGADRDTLIDRHIEAASRYIDAMLSLPAGAFIPATETRKFRWPQRDGRGLFVLHLDKGLISLTSISDESAGAAVSTGNLFLEPNNEGPPYWWIEVDLSTTEEFRMLNTPQRAIHVVGSWGENNDTKTAGTVTSGLAADATVTTFVCSSAALIDVGDTLLIQSEQLFVSGRSSNDVGKNTNGALTADPANTTVTLEGSHGVLAGEVILINSEKMFVDSVATNDLTVQRAYDGTVLAAHNDAQDVYVYRTLTVVRGVNGTTGATHANATAISKYAPPLDIEEWCVGEAIVRYEQEQSGWTGVVGAGEAAVNAQFGGLKVLREAAKRAHRRLQIGAV